MTATLSHLALLHECVDALDGFDADRREQHIEYLELAINDPALSGDMKHAFARLVEFFRANSGSESDPFDEHVERDALLASLLDLAQKVGGTRYVFHGTIQGRLEPIASEGLQPGSNSAWHSNPSLKSRCFDCVFFADTWRAAANWAQMSAAKARGPIMGKFRQPVVVRMSADGLTLEKDKWAVLPGSLMVRGPVGVSDASVFLGPLVGFPIWVPLADALALTKRERAKTKPG